MHLPKDRISQAHQGFGFCEFMTEEDADYACQIMNQIKMWGKPIRVNKVRKLSTSLTPGFVRQKAARRWRQPVYRLAGPCSGRAGSDRHVLCVRCSQPGSKGELPCDIADKIARDPTTGESKGYGFVSYNDFESSDSAIANMDGQFMMNKPITVQYAFKPDGKGERHGTAAERLLSSQAK